MKVRGTGVAAHALQHGVGVPQRKVPRVLRELTGGDDYAVAAGAKCVTAGQRELGVKYEHLRGAFREAPSVPTDDNGWRAGGKSALQMRRRLTTSADSTGTKMCGRFSPAILAG